MCSDEVTTERGCASQTKHFLLIGFLAMLIGSIVFGTFVIRKADNKMQVPAQPST